MEKMKGKEINTLWKENGNEKKVKKKKKDLEKEVYERETESQPPRCMESFNKRK